MARRRRKRALTDKQRAAADEYLINGFNKAAAMRKVGYSENTCLTFVGRVFNAPAVVEYLDRAKAKRAKRHELTEDWLIERFMERIESGKILAPFKKIADDGSLYWDFTGATEDELALVSDLGVEFAKIGRGPGAIDVTKFKIKEPDVHAAMMALMRYLGLFDDKLDTTSGDQISRIQAGRDRAARADNEDTVH